MGSRKQVTALVGVVAVAATLVAAGAPAASGRAAAFRPVIGKPSSVPRTPVAGKRFAVSFRVTRSDTGAALRTGTMTASAAVAGKRVALVRSFRQGVARVALVMPPTASGRLTVAVTIRAGGRAATRRASFAVVAGARPTISIDDASGAEGDETTTLAFDVRLSTPSGRAVSVRYATSDGTALAPGDYASATGTLTFAPGETSKTISIPVVGDAAAEADETFGVTLSDPVNAAIADGTATGTIGNDDTAPPAVPGEYRGATQDGNYVFLTVLADGRLTGFRVNDLPEDCNGPFLLRGGVDWSDSTFTIRSDGSFTAQGTWTGSVVQGDLEFTGWSASLSGRFSGASVSGTVTTTDEVTYQGAPYRCTTGEVRWSATRVG